MQQAIRDWLNATNRDYRRGLAILQQLDPESAKPLSTGHQRPEQLFFALRSMIGKPANKPVPEKDPLLHREKASVTTAPNKITNVGTPIKPNTTENDISAEQKRIADKLFKEISNKRALLFDLCPAKHSAFENEAYKVAERAQLTKEVMDLQYKVDEAYEAYDFALTHGRLPQKVAPEAIEDKDLHKHISNARKYISKLRNLDNPSDKQLIRLQEKEDELQKLLAAYDKL